MICNTGIGLIPRVRGEVDLFEEQGLYDGLFIMVDSRTHTYWNHMTGEALYGPLAGERLELENVLHSTVEQALKENPDALVAISDHPRAVRRSENGGTLSGLMSRIRRLSDMFTRTIADEDARRPTMDIGIGLWDDELRRYYPLETVEARDRVVFDDFGARRVLVYYDPTMRALSAFFTDAEDAAWDGDVLRLSDSTYVESGVLMGPDGESVEVERPLQVFTRWYGFSLTFPGAEVYGEGG